MKIRMDMNYVKETTSKNDDDKSVTPTMNDILCGRGKTFHNHRGNQRFRAVIAVHIPKYADETTTRKQKTKIVQSIAEEMYSEGCRFLKQDEKSEKWHDVGLQKAKQKVGHAIRDATAEMVRSLKRQERSRQRKLSKTSSSSSNNPSPAPTDGPIDKATGMPSLARPKTSLPLLPHKNLKKDDSSNSSADSDTGLFPASDFFKYADIEPISIASMPFESQLRASEDLEPYKIKPETIGSSRGDGLGGDDVELFSSVLDMLNEASNVMNSDDI